MQKEQVMKQVVSFGVVKLQVDKHSASDLENARGQKSPFPKWRRLRRQTVNSSIPRTNRDEGVQDFD